MAQWYVKDLSKLAGVSVQTLHHYDRIDLLKPSIRLTNGYRAYSETDLLKLQQIIALKFFGFALSQVKTLLSSNVDIGNHFSIQAQLLEKKANTMLEASKALKNIIANCSDNKSIYWENIIKLIEVYRMVNQLEKTWAGKVLTPEELKQYAGFESDLKTRFTLDEKTKFEQAWKDVVDQIKSNIHQDPKSELGISIGKRCMDLINGLYGTKHANLKHIIWNKGFKKGNMGEEHALTPELIDWLDQAIDTYYRKRIYSILDQVTNNVSAKLYTQWNELMTEMYGNSEELKQELINVVIADGKVSTVAKQWLKQLSK